MKAITKRFLAVFLSLFLVIAPTIQQANAASSWSISSAVSAGSRTIVSATKSGYKSAVNIAPTAGRLAIKLGKGANWAALIYAAVQLAPELKDIDAFYPNYPNNSVDYKETRTGVTTYTFRGVDYPTLEAGCQAIRDTYSALRDYKYCASSPLSNMTGTFGVKNCENCRLENYGFASYKKGTVVIEKSIPISTIAPQVIKNANSGHSASQAATRETATEMVVGGQFDQDLLAGAVPTSDTRPLVPSVPISGNGNVTHGSDVGIDDDGMSGATPGQQSDAATSAADAARKAAQAAADAATSAAEDARRAADDAADLVNSGADAAAIAAAEAAKAAAEKSAADLKAAADAAVAAANQRAAAAERAAAAATQAAAEAATQAAADLAAAQAAGDAAAIAAAEAAKAAADAAVADAKAKQAAAEKAAEKAKAEAAKPFELPAFCSWAAIVCETAEWLKREPETPEITAIDTDSPIDDFDSDKSYITFTGSCPPKYTASLSIMGATAPFEFDYTPICTVMSYLKPFIVGAGYIAAAYIIAGHSRGSKD